MIETLDPQIISLLKRDILRNMNMLYFMQDNPVYSLERIGDAVLLRGDSDHRWVYVSCSHENELSDVMTCLTPEDHFFAIIEDWMIPHLLAGQTPVWQMTTLKLFMPDEIPFPHHSPDYIRPLSEQDAPYLYENYLYQGVTSVDYIRDRIRLGPGAGIDQDGRLVAWVLTHDDSAIGMMHVLEPYRRCGYAYELTVWMIHRIRQLGRIPFVQIEESNSKSISLVLKLGFVTDRRVHWFEIR